MFGILTHKKCTKCGEEKSLDKFPRQKKRNGSSGWHSWCQACLSKSASEWGKNNPEKRREQERKRYAADPSKKKSSVHKYYQSHKEKVIERDRKYREANKEKRSLVARIWRALNPEKVKAMRHKAYVAHKQNRPTYWRNRRALEKGSGGVITFRQWEDLKAFYNYTCLCCGRQEPEIALTLDHVKPLSIGGANTIDNAQPLCKSCNSKKHAKEIDYR